MIVFLMSFTANNEQIVSALLVPGLNFWKRSNCMLLVLYITI